MIYAEQVFASEEGFSSFMALLGLDEASWGIHVLGTPTPPDLRTAADCAAPVNGFWFILDVKHCRSVKYWLIWGKTGWYFLRTRQIYYFLRKSCFYFDNNRSLKWSRDVQLNVTLKITTCVEKNNIWHLNSFHLRDVDRPKGCNIMLSEPYWDLETNQTCFFFFPTLLSSCY